MLLLRDSPLLRAVAGVGVDEEELSHATVQLASASDPLVRVLDAGPSVEREGAPFGFAFAALLPLPGRDAGAEAIGVVALELEAPAAELDEVQALLWLCAPMLERQAELERAQREVAAWSTSATC